MATIVTTTGTGTPIPHPDRAGAGTHVQYGDIRLQFDAGRNTMTRLVQMGLSPRDLSAVFLTHYHSDHVVGLTDVLLTHWVMDWADEWPELPVVSPTGPTASFVDRMFSIWDDDLAVRAAHGSRSTQPRVRPVAFDVPDGLVEVWSQGEVRVLAGQVRHEPVEGAVGYRIETPDGVVAISGDTRVCDEMAVLCDGADVVVYEAMRVGEINKRPPHMQHIKHYHADTREIGEQMQQLDVPTLMLTHLIPAPVTDDDTQAFIDEVRSGGYTGEVLVCEDLTSVTIGT